jgi:hydrogenase-1 operon protein HyaE
MHELIQSVVERAGYPVLTEKDYDDWLSQDGWQMVFFGGDPKRYPEALDVIVVLPELQKAFPQFLVAVIDAAHERALAKRYGFSLWPTLVFLKDGEFVDMISRVQNWDDYLAQISVILTKSPTRPPSIGIPVATQ